jgi:DNA (cytosine-5)-methyltransferase 1
MRSQNDKKFRAVDLFAGIGGIRLAFERAGFEIVYSNDIDKYACKTYRANFGEIDERDIGLVKSNELPNFDVLLAGFPCQPFSMIGKRDGLEDKRGQVFFEIIRILNDKKPAAFFLENVKHLLRHNGGKTFEFIKKQLEDAGNGYTIFYKVLNSKDFGLPQNRERTYIVGVEQPSPEFSFPQYARYARKKTLKDILDKKVDEAYYLSEKYYTGLLNHKERHKKQGSGFGCEVLDTNGIANTLVCGNMGRERNLIKDKPNKKNRWGIRRLTEREYAKLQGFPDTFKIPVSTTQAYKQFGNTVSVPIIKELATALKKMLYQKTTLRRSSSEYSLSIPVPLRIS